MNGTSKLTSTNCERCGKYFTYDAEYYKYRGFHKPRKCFQCRTLTKEFHSALREIKSIARKLSISDSQLIEKLKEAL